MLCSTNHSTLVVERPVCAPVGSEEDTILPESVETESSGSEAGEGAVHLPVDEAKFTAWQDQAEHLQAQEVEQAKPAREEADACARSAELEQETEEERFAEEQLEANL